MSGPATSERFPFPAVLDNTMMSDWKSCRHQFFLRHIMGLRPVDPQTGEAPPTSVHLHFGGALARGLEVTRRSWHTGDCEQEDSIQAGATALLEFWSTYEPPTAHNRNEANKTLGNCLLAHAGYFREWPLDDPAQALATINGTPLVEFSFAVPIPGSRHPQSGQPLVYAGRFDAALNRGKLWGLDDKTTGSNVDSATWRSQWTLASQFSGYTWGAREWGLALDGFLIHGVQVLTDSTRYAEAISPRPKWLVDAWLAQLQEDVHSMCAQYGAVLRLLEPWEDWDGVSSLLGAHPFGRNYGSACHAYNHPCAYLDDLCAQPRPGDWLDRFTVERWDPLRRSVDA